jgi:hypothetical protein
VTEDAYLRELNRLVGPAFQEAEAMGFRWVGPEDFILAILARQDESPARAALEHFGITHDAFADALVTSIAGADPPVDHSHEYDETSMNPAAYQFMGRAEGIAVGLGAPAVTLEHALIAYLWDDSGEVEGMFGVQREAVLERLGRLGVPLPAVGLPPPKRLPGRRVFVPYGELTSVLGELMARLPSDSGIGFNHDGSSRAWVSAYPEIDLQRYVTEVLDQLGLEPELQPESG